MAVIKTGVAVRFAPSVVRRCGGTTKDMRGVVLRLVSHGKVAVVDCGNTYPADDGRTVRSIPSNNLVGA